MKKYLLSLFVSFFIGCDNFHNHRTNAEKPSNSIRYAIIVIDGCQYLQFRGYASEIVTHKGDRTNKIHCFNPAVKVDK